MNKMKQWTNLAALPILSVIFLCAFGSAVFAGNGKAAQLWQKVNENRVPQRGTRMVIPEKYLVFRLNETNLQNRLARIADEEILMDIPMPDGSVRQFRMRNAPVLSDELAAVFPTWKNFRGEAVGDSRITGRFDWNVNGFHGYIETAQGTIYIDPYQRGDRENYLVFYKHEFGRSDNEFFCRVEGEIANIIKSEYEMIVPNAPQYTFGAQVRNFRLAVATTGEWARNAAGYTGMETPIQIRTAALGVVNTTVNRLNGIYEREVASTFTLNNPDINDDMTNIIFDDPATDPYDNTDSGAQLNINQTTIDTRRGTANYDIGHLYGTGGGGVASSPSLCRNGTMGFPNAKAQGYSARGTNTGDPFTVDYVAHEIGHQFGADHTYNNVDAAGACTTRNRPTAFEPASGATIMSYVGICTQRNLQQFVDTGFPSFHVGSLTEIVNNFNTDAPNTIVPCGTAAGANNIPTVNAGASFTIPRLTPFMLTATGADADAGDVGNLLYSWEEYDVPPVDPMNMANVNFAASGALGQPADVFDVDTDGKARPILRAYSPVASNVRSFPSLTFILNPANNDPAGSNQPPLTYTGTHPTNAPGAVCTPMTTCVIGERLPTIDRLMNFRVSIRDRRGGIADAGMTVTVAAGAGPFRVTAQDTLVDSLAPNWTAGTMQTVTWDVAGTNAAPVNTANVNILLSTDGGQTFPITLLANTPNDGTEQITVPNNPTMQARIKVEAVGNVFFDISNVNFTIVAPVAAQASVSGRVTASSGRSVSGATVVLVDQNGVSRRVRTSTFGYYRFDDLEVGGTYTISVTHKRYQFAPQIISVNEDLDGIDFIANE